MYFRHHIDLGSNRVATSPCGHLYLNSSEFKFNELKIQFVVPATFQVFNSHLEQVATMLASSNRQHSHHHQEVYWTARRPLIKGKIFPLAPQTLVKYDLDSSVGNVCKQIPN